MRHVAAIRATSTEIHRITPRRRVHHVDPSEEMLKQCRERVRDRGPADRVDLVCREVESLDLDASYELAQRGAG